MFPPQTINEVYEPATYWLSEIHPLKSVAELGVRLSADRLLCDLGVVNYPDEVIADIALLEASVAVNPNGILPVYRRATKLFDVQPLDELWSAQNLNVVYKTPESNQPLVRIDASGPMLHLQYAEVEAWMTRLEKFRAQS